MVNVIVGFTPRPGVLPFSLLYLFKLSSSIKFGSHDKGKTIDEHENKNTPCYIDIKCSLFLML